MTYTITNRCIACVSVSQPNESRCQSVCPTEAVHREGSYVWIDSSLCNNCFDAYGIPQCAAVCPTNGGCVPSSADYWESWFNTYNRLVARLQNTAQVEYWDQWFDAYSDQLSKLLHSRKLQLNTP